LSKHKAKSTAPEKQSVVSQKQLVVYTSFTNIKTEIKELKDRENAHRDLYWFTLNPELHPVFPETTGESTKQSTLDHLHHNQRSDLDPLKTHTSFGQTHQH